MDKKNRPLIYKNLFLLVGVLLLINPVIIYIVFGKIWLSLLTTLVAVVLTVGVAERKKLRGMFTIWLNFLIVISIFIHSEAVFTSRFPEYIIEDLYKVNHYYYFNRPYLDKTFQDKEYNVRYKTNAQGFRIGSDDDPDVRVQECDWLFIGDSYTQGAQVEYEDLFTSKLFDSFPNKIIVNAGISGMGIIDEYYYYVNEGKLLKPEKIFLQICNFNDFMKVEKRTAGFSDYLMHHSNFARFMLYDLKYANPAELPLGRWTEPFYPDKKSNIDYNIFYREQSEKKKRDLKNFCLYLQKFSKAAAENGSELILFQIPTKEQVHFKYLNEVLSEFDINIEELDMNFPNRWLSKQCKNQEIAYLDLLPDFTSSQAALFYDFDEHLNILGHQQIANSLRKKIEMSPSARAEITMLSKSNAGDRYPVFDIHDSTVFFQSWRDGNMELFSADSTMQSVQRITWNNRDELHSWPSPDGRTIVFTEGDQALNTTKVILMDINGTNRRSITNGIDTFGAIPSFSPDGNWIAYAAWHLRSGNFTNPYIVLQQIHTNEVSIITSDDYEHWRPIFSPDGKTIYYIAKDKDDQFDIYAYSLQSKKRTNLTKSTYDEWDPSVSPDGSTMVYSARQNGNWDLFLLDLQSGVKRRLTDSKGDEWDPTFSPSGKTIYYAATYGLRNGIFKILTSD
ncbi:hypothetical protein [Sphingobacterium bambusae]|uniref:SGNH hydrolase-type esterase domain-containing protein n=1 Tax=Sphingobacterium bambusae TaxID=662858 RepID=A0ABW6BM89_9SPHI|nr:hypothetical protein [Sphingobacterium bambusae]WPL49364.1 hypothetical protein SCB77_02720 [Sphingobacterium bambusae]